MYAWNALEALDSVFDDVMRSTLGAAVTTRTYAPELDVRAEADKLVFQVDLPGVKKEDVELSVDRGVLTLKASRKYAGDGAKGDQVLLGRSYGTFSRSFTLPDYADTEHLTASLADGVLTLTIPKLPKAQPRRITIGGKAEAPGGEPHLQK